MNRRAVSGIMLIPLLISMLTLAFNIQLVETEDTGSPAEKIGITYYFSEPEIRETWLSNSQIGDCISVTMEGLPQCRRAGLPVLPFKTARILLPFGTELQRVRVIEGKEVLLSGSYLVEWGQEPVPLSHQVPVEPTPRDETIYDSSYPFPGGLYSDVSVQSKMGYKILLVNLHPVQYIPKTGNLFYHERITVEVDVGPEGESERLSCRGLPQDRETVMGMVDNPEAIDTYPLSGESPTYEYVIITNETLKATPEPYNFQALIDEKISRGISACINTTEQIYASYSGTRPDGGEDNQTRIRNFIIHAYNNWGTTYVLLGGDGDGGDAGGESGNIIIPHRGFASICGEIDYDIPADMYYGCLDGTFDNDTDGTYGEPGDGPDGGEVDLFAEVYIGRACVDSQTEVRNFVNKTLAYQATIDSLDLREVWMVGEYLGFGGVADWGGNYKDEMKAGSDAYGYTTIGFENSPYAGRFDVSILYDRDWSGNNWAKSEMISTINNDIHLLNHLGHADVGYVMKMTNDDVDSLTNKELYFIGYSQGCYSGSFDNRNSSGLYTDYDCISEHLTTEASGAVAFVSNSRYGWGAWYSTAGPSQYYDREFWDAVLGEDIFNIGIANQDSKEDNAGWISSWVMRYCYYEINLFGDPELGIKIEGVIRHDSHEIADDVGGDGDGIPEPGESINMSVTLRNTHLETDFADVTATLYTTTLLPELIFYEDFEETWPGNWTVGDSNHKNGADYWGNSTYRANVGSWSAYCADESDVPGQEYDNYMYSYMNRTVDLTGYEIAYLSYYYWLDSEEGYDYLKVGYYNSTDSSWYWPKSYDGYIGEWVSDRLSIPATATSVGFLFDSDSIVTYEGAYVDEVTLTAYCLGPDSYINITDGYEEYGNINAGGTATSFDDYNFEIVPDCPQNHAVTFNLEIATWGVPTWTDSFGVTIDPVEIHPLSVSPSSVIDDTLTPKTTLMLRPDGDSAPPFNKWIGTPTNTSGDWNDVTPDGDTSYFYTTSDGVFQSSTLENHTAESWSISRVKVTVVAKGSSSKCSLTPIVVIGGSPYNGTIHDLTTTYQTYTSEWGINPSTCPCGPCEYWTWTDIDALEAGVYSLTVPDGEEIRVTQIYVEVSGPRLTVDITVNDIPNLWGWQFELSYNPNVIQGVYADQRNCSCVVPHVPIVPGPFLSGQFAPGAGWDNTVGKLYLTGAFWGTASGSGVIATVIFDVVGLGETEIRLDGLTGLMDPWGAWILKGRDHVGDGYFRNVDLADIPTASFTYSADPPVPEPLEGYNVTFTSTSAGGTPPYTYQWYFWKKYHHGPVPKLDGPIITSATDTTTHNYTRRGTWNVTLTVIDNNGVSNTTTGYITIKAHDIFIIDIKTNATWSAVPRGLGVTDSDKIVQINVTAKNQGHFTETFNVTCFWSAWYAGGMHYGTIDTQYGITLAAGATTTVSYYWDTAGRNLTHLTCHAIHANASRVPYEYDIEWSTGKIAPNEFTCDRPHRPRFHDIAVTKVVTNATGQTIDPGENVEVYVTVKNQGDFNETNIVVKAFAQKASQSPIEIGSRTLSFMSNSSYALEELPRNDTETITFLWDTSDRAGNYTLWANATQANYTGDYEPYDNTNYDGWVKVRDHDVAVTNIGAWPTAAPKGQPVYINVTVENQGDFTETFDVIVYADQWGSPAHFDIGSETVSLDIEESRVLEFVWNTIDVPCGSYWITAEAILPDDADPADNIARTRVGGICVPYSPSSVDIIGLLIPIASVILVVVLLGAAALGLFKILMSPKLRWPRRWLKMGDREILSGKS